MAGAAAIVVALVAVDVVLVALALARTSPEMNGVAGPAPTFRSAPSTAATPTPSPSPTAAAERVSHLLSAIDADEAWRASSEGCGGSRSQLQRTTDGGRHWQSVDLGPEVRTINALRATATGVSVGVGIGSSCGIEVLTTTDDGASWANGDPDAVGAGVTDAGLIFGGSVVETPCADPADVFRGNSTTLVACDDELEWRSGAGPWVEVPIGGVRAVAVDGGVYTLARAGQAGCDGVQIETLTASGVTSRSSTTPIGCNRVSGDRPVAMDQSGKVLWMWSGDEVDVSQDGGATW